MKNFKSLRWFSCILAAFIILCTGIVSAHAAAQKLPAAVPVSQNAAPENALLQFTAGGHILGFKPDRVYFATFDHAIIEEFVGTKGVMPAANSSQHKGLTPGFKPETGKGSTEGFMGAPALGKVIYKNLWQGITLKYEAKNGGIAESSYTLEPKADVKDIKLKYNVSVGIEKDGSLRFRHPSEKGYFSQSAPKAWQDIDGKRTHVEVAFADYGDNTIGFRLGAYNRQYPVVIDPTYQWHTFYGSAGIDVGYAIAVDTGGNVYVTGYSNATWGSPVNPYSAGYDIVVMKLNSSGVYQWHTFYGSAGDDYGYGIAVDTSGNVYVTGQSNATWNAGVTTPVNAYSSGTDIVVMKLNSSGIYQWHTFYGAAGSDGGQGITVDTGGNVYVTGFSNATWGSPVNAYSGGGGWDIVVLKLNTSGTYQWHTFYGATTVDDAGQGIAVDTSGNVYVAGYSNATWGSPVNPYSGGADIVVLKLNSAGAYQWHTFHGSAGNDYGNAIALDTSSNVYVTGYSTATWGSPLNAFSGGMDIVVLKLNSAGALQWNTFYGGTLDDQSFGITTDTSGNVYVIGDSTNTWGSPLNAFSGGIDIVVLKLNTSGAYQWHTFYGAAAVNDNGFGIAVGTSGNIYVTGYSGATWTSGATTPVNAYSGANDIMILKLSDTSTVTANASGTGAGTVASDVGGISYTYSTTSTGATTAINYGTSVIVTATGTNSAASWGGTCTTAGGVEAGNGTATATCTIASLTANQTVTASFTLNTYTLTITKSGTGTGTVTSSPSGINCGATCSATYNTGTVVTLTATSDANMTFTGWSSGGCSGTGTCSITMNAATAVTATFISATTLGGVPSEGNLQITARDDGSIGITRYVSGQWQNQIYYWASKGSRLQINGTGYSFGGYGSFVLTGTAPTLVSNTKASTTQTTTIWTSGGIRLTQDITYQAGASYYGLNWTLTNESGGALSDLRFFHGEDTYFYNNDYGAGFWDAANNTIGVMKTVNSILMRMSLQAITTPYAYDSMQYNNVSTNINAGALSNTIDSNTSTDNGYALEWRRAAMQNGEIWSITAYEKFADVSVGSLSVTAPILTECTTGTVCNLVFTVKNISQASVSASLTPTVNQAGWSVTLTSPASPVSIAAGGSQQVVVTVSVPSGATAGTIGNVTLSASDGTTTSTDIATVRASALYTVTASAGTGGTVSCNPTSVNSGSTSSCTVTANSGYSISSVSGCGGTLSGNTYTTGAITANCTVSATFTVTATTYTVTASAGTGGSISPSSATVNSGNTTSFTVTPNSGYSISAVSGCGGTLSGSTYTTGAITANCTVTASFSANASSVNGVCGSANGGSFTTAPTGNLCATGTASAVSGSGPWTWTCSGANGGTNASCSAAMQTYTITASAGTGGSVSCSPATVNSGSSSNCTITPNTGFKILDVSVDGVSAGAVTSYTFSNVTANHTISATFAVNTFTITASAGTGGSVSCSPTTVNSGSSSNCTITPNTGFKILDVSVDGASAGAITSYTFSNVTANHTISATFTANTYTITASAGTGGSVSCSPTTVNSGSSSNCTITPNTGFKILDVSVDGASAGAITSYTFSNVTANHTISATFAVNTFTITASAGTGGSVSCSPTTVNSGSSSNCTITPNTGFKILDVSVDGASAGAITSYTFSNVTANHTISATFTANTYTITASAGTGGTISPSTPQVVNANATTSFTVTPDSGYNIETVTGCGGTLSGSTYITGPITANCAVSATFKTTFTIMTPAGPIEVAPGKSVVINVGSPGANVIVDGISIGAVAKVTLIDITGPHTITW